MMATSTPRGSAVAGSTGNTMSSSQIGAVETGCRVDAKVVVVCAKRWIPMKLISYSINGQSSIGALIDERVYDLSRRVPPVYMVDGDEIVVEIDGVGLLRNKVVAE